MGLSDYVSHQIVHEVYEFKNHKFYINYTSVNLPPEKRQCAKSVNKVRRLTANWWEGILGGHYHVVSTYILQNLTKLLRSWQINFWVGIISLSQNLALYDYFLCQTSHKKYLEEKVILKQSSNACSSFQQSPLFWHKLTELWWFIANKNS